MNESRPVSPSGSEPQNEWVKRRTKKILIIWCVTVGVVFVLFASLLFVLAKAGHRAQSTACINNIKQINLSALLWSKDHNRVFPPSFLSMSNELMTPKVLVCPQDRQKIRVSGWSEFNPAQNLSYEFVQPGAKESDGANQVVFRCPIHGHAGHLDGSVQRGKSW
jgi:hypothetical protein